MNNKNFYLQAITRLLNRCNDLSLLDLIYILLCKEVDE